MTGRKFFNADNKEAPTPFATIPREVSRVPAMGEQVMEQTSDLQTSSNENMALRQEIARLQQALTEQARQIQTLEAKIQGVWNHVSGRG